MRIDLAVELWVYDVLEDEKYFKERKQYFDTSKYVAQLVKDEDIKQLMEIYLKDIWKETDRTLNNYVHGNGRKYILDNYLSYGDYQKRKQKLIETVHNITSIFISILSIALPNKIQSSAYRDDMEQLDESEGRTKTMDFDKSILPRRGQLLAENDKVILRAVSDEDYEDYMEVSYECAIMKSAFKETAFREDLWVSCTCGNVKCLNSIDRKNFI